MFKINKKKLVIIPTIIITSLLFFVSCNTDGITESEYQIQYTRTAQLENIYENEILVLSNEFIQKTTLLQSNVQEFKTNSTLVNLTETQASWVATLKVWKQLELYNLGAVENSFIHFEINRWATNTETIDEYIDGNETINDTFIASKGSSAKGIAAIEYLLFSSEENQEVLNSFKTDLNFERRLNYLEALAINLKIKANALLSIWENDKDNFISSLENGISGSQNQLTNAMINLIEEIIISKLGNPLGDKTGGIINVDALEAARSKSSLIIIQEHLTALKRCFTGEILENDINWGFDNYLSLIERDDLNTSIIEAFNTCQTKIDTIKTPLIDEIKNTPENVTNLQDAFRNLLILIKVDLSNAIGATVTLNDNDGD
jgi:predicted lipoprotein